MFYKKASNLAKLMSWNLEYTNLIKIKFIITIINRIFTFILFGFQEHFLINTKGCPLLISRYVSKRSNYSQYFHHAETSHVKFEECYITNQWDEFRIKNATFCLYILFWRCCFSSKDLCFYHFHFFFFLG